MQKLSEYIDIVKGSSSASRTSIKPESIINIGYLDVTDSANELYITTESHYGVILYIPLKYVKTELQGTNSILFYTIHNNGFEQSANNNVCTRSTSIQSLIDTNNVFKKIK